MSAKISIVILNYKNWQDTLECLQTILAVSYRSHRIAIVDNDSRNGSLDEIDQWLSLRQIQSTRLTQEQSETGDVVDGPVVLIQSGSNRGYAAGNNIGIRWAIRTGSPYVLILNNDTLVDGGFLEPLVEFLESHSQVAMVGPLLRTTLGDIDKTCARTRPGFFDYLFRLGPGKKVWPGNPWGQSRFYFDSTDYSAPFEVEVLSGSCILIRTSFLESIGLLDEHTFLFAEEYILSERARSAQKATYLIPKSSVIHKHGQSIKQQPSSAMQRRVVESHFYYLRRYRRFSLARACWYVFWPFLTLLKVRATEYLKGG